MSSSKDQTVLVWDVDDDFRVVNILVHDDACSYLAWSPQDGFLVTAANDNVVRLWSPRGTISFYWL